MKRFVIVAAVTLIAISLALGVWSVSANSKGNDGNTWPYPPPEATLVDENSAVGEDTVADQLPSSEPYPAPAVNPTTTYVSPQNVTYSFFVYLPIIMRSYDRAAAVAHADQFAHDRSSDYPNFGTGCDCNDCTNYVSQSINKGGVALKTGNWDENSPFEWWYRKVFWWYEYSKTWSAADWFNTYLFQYPEEFEFRGWPDELEAGDFFLLDLHGAELSDPPDGIPDHARFIVGMGNSSIDPADYTCTSNPIPPSTFGLLANQHCVDRKHIIWNYNLEDFGPWPFHVVDMPTNN